MRALLVSCLAFLCCQSIGAPGTFAQAKQAAFDSSPTALLNHLAGRWAGDGTIKWFDGQLDPYKCVMTFFVQDAGTRARQNFRCHGKSDYIGDGNAVRFELSIDWRLQGDKVTGNWHERVYEFRGTAQGHIKGNQVLANIDGDVASAEVTMTVGECEARVVMQFREGIERLDATGRKC